MSLNDSLPRYHAVGLGVDRIQIYDQDGTAEPFVREFVASGLVASRRAAVDQAERSCGR